MKEGILAVDMSERGVWLSKGDMSEWDRIEEVPDEHPEHFVSLVGVTNGFIVCGGCDDFSRPPVSLCHHFSFVTRQWKKLSNMLTPRYAASAIACELHSILVVGGCDGDGNESTVCEMLDYVNDKWSAAENLPKALSKPLIEIHNGRVYILPRDKIDNIGEFRLLEYNPFKSDHSECCTLPEAVKSTSGACLLTAFERLYLLGGEQRLAMEYWPYLDQWFVLSSPTLKYDSSCCGVLVQADYIYLFGGRKDKEEDERNAMERCKEGITNWTSCEEKLPFSFCNSLCIKISV